MEKQVKIKTFGKKDDAHLAVIKTASSINALCSENNVGVCGIIYGVAAGGVDTGSFALMPNNLANRKLIAIKLIELAVSMMKHQHKGSIFDSFNKIINGKSNPIQKGERNQDTPESNT